MTAILVVAIVCEAIGANMMSCGCRLTVKDRVTGVAALTMAVPNCVAVIEQVPTVKSETTPLATEQTGGVADVSVTASPADEVAVTVNGPKLIECAAIGVNVMT